MESFFGHLKDEVEYKQALNNLEELKRMIETYINYDNTTRKQWNLQKMTPAQYEVISSQHRMQNLFLLNCLLYRVQFIFRVLYSFTLNN
ncbi:hypothetical protein AC625_03395 [Peribacillus loiseleuriae]|uniref:Integrase catalytic domain-containing protein n=1 Tax=Peribacillus loiseleuriae TaxID=1679170 RepID=A0A0K9GPT5_9BACI|nr:hypothetical protein AC625_03395 [Peribacillus loiseleuriae]